MLWKVNIGQKYQKGALLREKGLKLKTLTLMLIYISYEFTYSLTRKSFKKSRRSSDNGLFLVRNSKGNNPAIRGQIKKW